MSWTWRRPRVPVQPGWHAPHDLVDDYAARGVEIATLTGMLGKTEQMLRAARAEIRDLNAYVQDLEGRIECQADRFEELRTECRLNVKRVEAERDEAINALGRLMASPTIPDLRARVVELELAETERDEAQQMLHEADTANRNLSRYNEVLARLLNQALDAHKSARDKLATALARQTDLEQAAVAATGRQCDNGWDGVVAAGLGVPDAKPQCPEGLLLDGVELHRCIRDGGHEGDHWNRGHQRQWPRIEANEDCEAPW